MRKKTYKLAFTLAAFGVLLAILNRWINFSYTDYKTLNAIKIVFTLIGYPLPSWIHELLPIPSLLTKLLHFFLLGLIFRRIYLSFRSIPFPQPNYFITLALIICLLYFFIAMVFAIFSSLGRPIILDGYLDTHITFDAVKIYQNIPFIILLVEILSLLKNRKK